MTEGFVVEETPRYALCRRSGKSTVVVGPKAFFESREEDEIIAQEERLSDGSILDGSGVQNLKSGEHSPQECEDVAGAVECTEDVKRFSSSRLRPRTTGRKQLMEMRCETYDTEGWRYKSTLNDRLIIRRTARKEVTRSSQSVLALLQRQQLPISGRSQETTSSEALGTGRGPPVLCRRSGSTDPAAVKRILLRSAKRKSLLGFVVDTQKEIEGEAADLDVLYGTLRSNAENGAQETTDGQSLITTDGVDPQNVFNEQGISCASKVVGTTDATATCSPDRVLKPILSKPVLCRRSGTPVGRRSAMDEKTQAAGAVSLGGSEDDVASSEREKRVVYCRRTGQTNAQRASRKKAGTRKMSRRTRANAMGKAIPVAIPETPQNSPTEGSLLTTSRGIFCTEDRESSAVLDCARGTVEEVCPMPGSGTTDCVLDSRSEVDVERPVAPRRKKVRTLSSQKKNKKDCSGNENMNALALVELPKQLENLEGEEPQQEQARGASVALVHVKRKRKKKLKCAKEGPMTLWDVICKNKRHVTPEEREQMAKARAAVAASRTADESGRIDGRGYEDNGTSLLDSLFGGGSATEEDGRGTDGWAGNSFSLFGNSSTGSTNAQMDLFSVSDTVMSTDTAGGSLKLSADGSLLLEEEDYGGRVPGVSNGSSAFESLLGEGRAVVSENYFDSQQIKPFRKAYKYTHQKRWGEADCRKFYSAVEMFGLDLMMIHSWLPRFSERQVRDKLRAEERRNPEKIERAIRCRRRVNTDQFETIHGAIDSSTHFRVDNGSEEDRHPFHRLFSTGSSRNEKQIEDSAQKNLSSLVDDALGSLLGAGVASEDVQNPPLDSFFGGTEGVGPETEVTGFFPNALNSFDTADGSASGTRDVGGYSGSATDQADLAALLGL